MDMKFCASILLVCFLGFERSVSAQDCSNKTLEFCLRFLSNDGLDVGHIDDDLPSWNETLDALEHRCSSFDKFSECMNGVTEKCSNRKYEGWIDAYEFLCKKSNLTLVVDYLRCYSSPIVVNSSVQTCKSVFEFKYSDLLNGSKSMPADKMKDYCKLADGFFACLNRTLTSNCGETAAKWQWTWDRTLNMPTLQSCPGWITTGDDNTDSETSAWTVALIIILILITCFMVLAIVFLLVFLLKKRKLRTRSQQMRRQTQGALPPPPYSAVMFTSSEPGAEPQAHLVDSGIALSAEELCGVDAPTAHSDVVLPPPYVGDRPPVPAYDSLRKNVREVEEKEATDEIAPPGQAEVNAGETNLNSDKNCSDE